MRRCPCDRTTIPPAQRMLWNVKCHLHAIQASEQVWGQGGGLEGGRGAPHWLQRLPRGPRPVMGVTGGPLSPAHLPAPLLQVLPSPPTVTSYTQILISRAASGVTQSKIQPLSCPPSQAPGPGCQEGLQEAPSPLPAPHP